MKGVIGGMQWTIIAIIIGAIAIALLALFMTSLGKEVVALFGGFVNAFTETIANIIGRIPIFGTFLRD